MPGKQKSKFRRRSRGGSQRTVTPRMQGGLRSENSIYRCRLVDSNSTISLIGSTAGGVIAGFINSDPSGGSQWTATEWSALTTLYAEIRLVKFSVLFIPANPEDTKLPSTGVGNALYVSSSNASILANPAGINNVYDNANCKIYNILSSRKQGPFKFTHHPQGALNWAKVTVPNPGSYAGCAGAIQWFGDGFPASTNIFSLKVEGVFEFRSRI